MITCLCLSKTSSKKIIHPSGKLNTCLWWQMHFTNNKFCLNCYMYKNDIYTFLSEWEITKTHFKYTTMHQVVGEVYRGGRGGKGRGEGGGGGH